MVQNTLSTQGSLNVKFWNTSILSFESESKNRDLSGPWGFVDDCGYAKHALVDDADMCLYCFFFATFKPSVE